jgi:predicted ATPase/DNA-binding CsgD family transcriptional regulator
MKRGRTVVIKNDLRAQLNAFVGRKKELVDVSERLLSDECRLLTLTGLGGSGKTRLAIEAANTVAAHFPQGTVFVALQPIIRSDLLVATIAQAIGLTFYGEGEPETQLLNYLREKSLLLLLDNFEHLLSGTTLVSSILIHAPKVKILVTSREALNLQEEWLYPLKGMSVPPSIYSTSLEDYEAVELFLYHARRIQPDFELVNEHESVISICEMTAGLPLAIELAASWLKGSSTAQIAREMQCNLDFLSTNMRNIEERHRSMRAVFDQSWRLLSENERLIFARLCIFNGSYDSEAAVQVAEASFSSLAALVEKSLVQMVSSDRFGIHEMLRQYGMEKLEAYGETEATYARHSRYFAQLMLQYETALQQPHQLETMQTIERDFENIRLAWEWSVKNQQVTNLHALLNGLYLFGFLGSHYHETISIFQNTLEQSLTDTALRGRLLVRRWGYLQWWYQADYEEAQSSIDQALLIAQARNDQFEIAFCHLMTAYVLISTERYADALPHLETSKALFEAINEPYYVCWVLHRMGYVYGSLNNIDKIKIYTELSLALARVTHNRVALFICLYNLGSDYILYGDYLKGKLYGAEALQIATESRHQGQIAHALSLLALGAFYEGDYATCQDYALRSRTIIEDINALVFEPYSQSLLILLACLREDYAEAVRLNELGKRHGTSNTDFQLHYWALAALSCGLGNPTEARLYLQKILQISNPDTQPAITIWIVPSVAYTLVETDPEKAVELLAWVFAYPDTTLHWVHQWPLFNRLQTQLQAVMDADSYQTHWEKGETLTFDSVKSYLHYEFRPSLDAETESAHQQLLTARESEILCLLAAGLTNPQIAAQLVIGAGTVKTHTLSIYRKLDVANRTQAIVRAQGLGLLPTTILE